MEVIRKWTCLPNSFCLVVHGEYPDFKNLEDNLYSSIAGPAPCFRLTDATRQIGCSGKVSRLCVCDWCAMPKCGLRPIGTPVIAMVILMFACGYVSS